MKGYDFLQMFKEEADSIRKEIDIMMNILVEKTEIVQEELHIDVRTDHKTLKNDIVKQKIENELLYKDLKVIQKQAMQQKDKISMYRAKIAELEQHVGIIDNSPHYDNIEEEKVGSLEDEAEEDWQTSPPQQRSIENHESQILDKMDD